jgi:peptide/nickel transport system permease protein
MELDLFNQPLGVDELNGIDSVVLDPPRAGAMAQVAELAKSVVPQVVYVSCNPMTIAQDAQVLLAGGYKLRQVQPVSRLISDRLPATLELSIVAALLALVLGIPMGVYTALKKNSWFSHVLLAVSLAGVSLPTFLIGILLILVFSVWLGWMPSFGRGDVVQIGWWSTGLLTASGLKALVLPAITLGLFQMTLIQRLVRSEMLEVLRTDYIRFARARGLSNRAVHFGHALKNTLVPVITITGLQLGAIIAFAIITETVFQWPGMGLLFIQAVSFADVPVMAAYLCLIALFFVVINLAVDLLYYVVDPRLRQQGH